MTLDGMCVGFSVLSIEYRDWQYVIWVENYIQENDDVNIGNTFKIGRQLYVLFTDVKMNEYIYFFHLKAYKVQLCTLFRQLSTIWCESAQTSLLGDKLPGSSTFPLYI